MGTSFVINELNGYSYFIAIAVLIMICAAVVLVFCHYIAKYVLIKLINKTLGKRDGFGKILFNNHVYQRIAYLIPALLLYHYAYIFNFESSKAHFQLYLASLIQLLTTVYVISGTALVISAILNSANDRYSNLPISKHKPIKSYVQVAKIILFGITGILVASVLIDKPPMYIFTGVSAATAIILLIFKDSIMGFVASIQLAAYDMVRIGDWIEMPNFGADGEVIEISLNTVKVQNFDKTIVTIPSYSLLTSGIKNWRGMQEAGGRRVKRPIYIDIHSIKICDEKLLEAISMLDPIMTQEYVKISGQVKRPINVALFRHYIEAYLQQHEGVHKGMKIIIRHLQGPPAAGLLLELYFFTNQTDSARYEAIQADIFEHLYAVLPRFDLQILQYPT